MSYLLTTEQIVEAKKLFEVYDAPAPDAYRGLAGINNFLDWCQKYFPQLIDRALESTMAHQLADADQALAELEADRLKPHGDPTKQSLETHVVRLRRAIDGTDYR